MIIGKSNIEAYLLDYLEGNLNPLLTAELMAFIAENPEYEKWLPEYDGLLCLTGDPVYTDKPLLKKDFHDIPAINPDNFGEFCIASAEGLLQADDTARLKEFLALHPEMQRDYELFHQLKLQPDMSLVYPHKQGLKKPVMRMVFIRYGYYALAAAASVALLLMLAHHKPAPQVFTHALPADTVVHTHEISAAMPGIITEPSPAFSSGQIRKSNHVSGKTITNSTFLPAPVRDAPVMVQLAVLKPIRESLIYSGQPIPDINRRIPSVTSGNLNPGSISTEKDEKPFALKMLSSAMKKLNFWKAAESALSGFNYLTESRLSITKLTDENGKFTGIALENGEPGKE